MRLLTGAGLIDATVLIGICFLARPHVLNAARVKENCFSLSSIAARSCQTWRRASTGKFCRGSGGLSPSPRVGGAAAAERPRNAREVGRCRGKPGRRRPEPGHKPAYKPAWKTTGLNRSARFRNPASGPDPRTVRRCRVPSHPAGAVWAAGRARHRDGEESSQRRADRQRRQ